MSVAWLLARVRLVADRYAVQLCESRDLQFAAIEEYAERRGRTFVVLEVAA